MPPRSTGLASGLNSSNQSEPEAGFAIHSLKTISSVLPSATAAAFALPGVGVASNFQRPPFMPIG